MQARSCWTTAYARHKLPQKLGQRMEHIEGMRSKTEYRIHTIAADGLNLGLWIRM